MNDFLFRLFFPSQAKDLFGYQKKFGEAMDMVEDLETEKEELEGEKNEALYIAERLEDEIRDLNKEVDQLERENSNLQDRVDELEYKIGLKEEEVSDLKREINDLDTELHTLKSHVDLHINLD